jgi:hypothetical protein
VSVTLPRKAAPTTVRPPTAPLDLPHGCPRDQTDKPDDRREEIERRRELRDAFQRTVRSPIDPRHRRDQPIAPPRARARVRRRHAVARSTPRKHRGRECNERGARAVPGPSTRTPMIAPRRPSRDMSRAAASRTRCRPHDAWW